MLCCFSTAADTQDHSPNCKPEPKPGLLHILHYVSERMFNKYRLRIMA